eukprot:gene1314-1331_t
MRDVTSGREAPASHDRFDIMAPAIRITQMTEREGGVMRVIGVAVGIACMLIVAGACADEIPSRKPGLWQMTIQPQAGMKPMQMSQCVNTQSEIADWKKATGLAQCSRQDISRSGNVTTIDSTCDLGGRKMNSHIVMTMTSETSYRTEIRTKTIPAAEGMPDGTIVQEGKWLGACPADMKPGDMIMPGGMRMPRTP